MLNKTHKDIRRIVIHFSFSEKLECIILNYLNITQCIHDNKIYHSMRLMC